MPVQSILKPFDIQVNAGRMAVREALSAILAGLRSLDLDIEEAGTVELVLAEALNNIVEHAYGGVRGSGPIRIRCQHRPDGIHFCIEDEGDPMPEGRLPLGAVQNIERDMEDLPEGGFGWFLIQDLAKDIRYERLGGTNRLCLRLAIAVTRAG